MMILSRGKMPAASKLSSEKPGRSGNAMLRLTASACSGAGAAANSLALDDVAANHLQQIRHSGTRHRLAEHAAGGEEIIRHQRRRAHSFPFDVTVVDDLDRGVIGLDRLSNPLRRERRLR